MSSIEARAVDNIFSASFFLVVTPGSAVFGDTPTSFVDINGNVFVARHILLRETSGNLGEISFDDPNNPASKTVHGRVPASGELFLRDKHADSIFIRGASTVVEVTAWR